MTCRAEGCRRDALTDWAWCETHRRKILESYREGRVVVRRMGVRPLPEMTELEKRYRFGDR